MDSQISFNETGTAPEKHAHKHGKYVLVFLLCLVAGITCWYIHRPTESITLKPGTICTVQFRRGDALGAADGLPVSPTGDVINGAEVSIRGEWITENHEAILLKHIVDNRVTDTKMWIPKSNILLIKYNNEPPLMPWQSSKSRNADTTQQ